MSASLPPVVLDTNVWVAAGFRPRSDSARLVEAVREGRVRLVWDDATRRETERIVSRIPPISWPRVAPLFGEEGRFEGRTESHRYDAVADPDDRKFAALAAAAGALLVTMDHHLLDEREGLPMTVCRPGEACERLGLREG